VPVAVREITFGDDGGIVRDSYVAVADLMSEAQFRANVAAVVEAWGGLLDEDAARRLVAAQLGRDVVDYQRVTDLVEGVEATVRVTVEEINPVREFTRQDGRKGRVANVVVRDESAAIRLVLWDDDADLVATMGLRPGIGLRLIDCFVRRTNFGLELSRGKFGRVLPT